MGVIVISGFAFAGACAAAHYLMPSGWGYWAALALIIALAAALKFSPRARRSTFAMILIPAALGLCWYTFYSGLYTGSAAGLDGVTRTVTVRVDEYPYRDDGYASVHANLLEDGYPRLGIEISDYSGALPELRPGDIARLELELMDASERYGEATDIYAARGTQLRAYFVSSAGVTRDWKSALYFPQEINRALAGSVRQAFPESVRAMMLGLLLGETHELYEDAELDNAMTVTGVMHVVSVSGMHLSFLFSLLVTLFGKKRAALLGMPVVILFTFVAGCTPAIVRSCVMLLLTMLGILLGRDSDGLTGLSLSLLLCMCVNPMSIASLGLQLSFASVFGILTVSPALFRRIKHRWPAPRGQKWRTFFRNSIISGFTTSIGAIIFTTPLIALSFGYVSLISPFSGILTLWAVSLAFNAGFIVMLVGLVFPQAASALAILPTIPAAYFMFMAKLLARLPFAAVYTADGRVFVWMIFTYASFALMYLVKPKGRGGHMRFMAPALCSLLLLAAVFISSAVQSSREHSVTVLDVGQGESVALLSGESAVLVDCGGQGTWDDAGDTASEFLLSRGRLKIDALVLTHLHSDHCNGAERLLYRIDVDKLYLPGTADDSDGELEAILAAAEANGTQVEMIYTSDAAVPLREMDLTLIAPETGSGVDDNEAGIVVYAGIEGRHVLITGDAGSTREGELVDSGSVGRAEVLVAGHHGSKYSSSLELLGALDPEIAVVSVGYNNYGHPTEDALMRLKMSGAEVYRTDVNGSVTIDMESSAWD